jgi:signal transduction histidine kinase
MAIVTSWVAHRISTRIRRVERQVTGIAKGDFQELEVGRKGDEIEDLSCSINRMCVELRDMKQTIRQSERTHILAQFAAGLAHQLRNSLTGARMSVQLHAKRFPPPDSDQSLNVALRQLAMTEDQVRGLLSLGRAERPAPEVCDIGQLLSEVVLLVEPACRHSRVSLDFQRPHEPIELLADPLSLRAAALNLTLNAIEAVGAGGTVCLEGTSTESEVIIEVADNGPGPPPELAETLCDAFVTSKPDGVGLGLALAQQVASNHSGRLSWTRANGVTRYR